MGTEVMKSPIELLTELSVLDKLRWKKDSALDAFERRECSFNWIHMGTTDVKIGKLLSLIQSSPELLPPRTGHIGNWEQIMQGRAGMMDFNNAICSKGYGYPLLYCFTQTETQDMQNGDIVYVPGSIVEQDNRMELPLFTWDRSGFVRRGREHSYFTPFVKTEYRGEFIPLIQVHKNRLQYQKFEFRFEPSIVYEQEPLVKRILCDLIEDASQRENSRAIFQDLISHQVTLDGRMYRSDLICEDRGFRMGEVFYSSASELVEAAMIPFRAVDEPDQFFQQIDQMPTHMPLVSNVAMRIFSAVVSSHYPDRNVIRSTMTQPFNPHFHWGARDMAGYPPKRSGYIATKSKVRSYRRICKLIIDRYPEVDPILFVVIPAVVFSLCPTDQHPRDNELLAELFLRVRKGTDHLAECPGQMAIEVECITLQWLGEQKSNLSQYFLDRFIPKCGILNNQKSHDFSRSVEPEGFRELSFQQSCMIVGSLMG
ncbi:hypothetical protein SAMN04487866_11231 [Thermoactinomyces sp. DSM 45891]|uniref:DUF6025 family protein n=1 Tax=Thermoactinomyces sp. DSM 45891 TaxID=1761907 RepID=UPI00091B6692|nr:DUF6025 family protein [Thermoactinomyces sp. DSM 45891]SFX57268.1 hypothetical protein SAMN04487866_11231 [Thermoactinomyces sp. DSM 45891]